MRKGRSIVRKLLKKRAGDGDRTRDVQLGNPKFDCKQRTYAFTSVRSVHIHPRRFSNLKDSPA